MIDVWPAVRRRGSCAITAQIVIIGLWMTASAAIAVEGRASRGLAVPTGALPFDARPLGDGRAAVLLVAESGVWEVALNSSGAKETVSRSWHAGFTLPSGFLGSAAYLADGTPVVVHQAVKGSGEGRRYRLLKLSDDGFSPWPVDSQDRPILALLAVRDGGLWVAYQPTPGTGRASLERWDGDRVSRRVVLPGPASVADWVEGSRGSLWLATGLGLLEVSGDAEPVRRSTSRAAGLAVDGSALAVAGSGLMRFNEGRLAPLATRWNSAANGVPILGPVHDLALASGGRWLALYRGGRLAIVEPSSGRAVLLGASDGVPPDAGRLFYEPVTDSLFFGGRDMRPVLLSGSSLTAAAGWLRQRQDQSSRHNDRLDVLDVDATPGTDAQTDTTADTDA